MTYFRYVDSSYLPKRMDIESLQVSRGSNKGSECCLLRTSLVKQAACDGNLQALDNGIDWRGMSQLDAGGMKWCAIQDSNLETID